MTRDALIRRIRAWFLVACPDLVAPTSPSLAARQIVAANQDGAVPAVRPAKPYLAIFVRTFDDVIDTDEDFDAVEGDLVEGDAGFDAAAPTRTRKGSRAAAFSVQGYGADSVSWLRLAALRLDRPDVNDAIELVGVGVPPGDDPGVDPGIPGDGFPFVDFEVAGPVQDVPQIVDTSTEARFVREFRATYRDTDDPVTLAASTVNQVTIVMHRADPPGEDADPLIAVIDATPST